MAGPGVFRWLCRAQGGTDSGQGSSPVPWVQVLCTAVAPEVAAEAFYSFFNSHPKTCSLISERKEKEDEEEVEKKKKEKKKRERETSM